MCNKTWNWTVSWVGSLARSCEVGLGVVFDVEAYMVDKSIGKTSPQKEPNVFQGGLRIFAHQEYCWECTGEYDCTVFTFVYVSRKFTHGSASTVDYMHWLIYIIHIYPSSFSFTVLHILGLMFQPFRNLRLCLCTANSCITEFEWWLIQWLLDFRKRISLMLLFSCFSKMFLLGEPDPDNLLSFFEWKRTHPRKRLQDEVPAFSGERAKRLSRYELFKGQAYGRNPFQLLTSSWYSWLSSLCLNRFAHGIWIYIYIYTVCVSM